jgi:hypothetical protein
MQRIQKLYDNFHIWGLFKAPETHPEAKTLKDYFEDLDKIITEIKKNHPDANLDEGFHKAAKTITKLLPITSKMESVTALESGQLEAERKEMMKKMGKDSLVNVTGEASKMFAQAYIKQLEALKRKEYWPSETCQSLFGQGYLQCYQSDFPLSVNNWNAAIDELESRISAYDENCLTIKL